MVLKEAKSIMEEMGIEVEERKIMKGSCLVDSLTYGSGDVRPTIYDYSIENMDRSDLISFIRRSLEQLPVVDLPNIKNKDFVLKHCMSCIRHQTEDEAAVKWPVYGDLEEYIRINLGDDKDGNHRNVVVTHPLLKSIGIPSELLREKARENLRKNVTIESMASVLEELIGTLPEEMEPGRCELMYVASNQDRLHGAAVMLLDDVLDGFCREQGVESIYLIPSSLHEIILIKPQGEEEEINRMIQEVNRTEVAEYDQLSDHVYTYHAA